MVQKSRMTIRDMDALYLKQDNKTLCLSHVVLSAIYIYTVSQKKKSQFVRFCGVCCLHCAILMGRCQLGRPVSGTWPICSSSQDSSKKKSSSSQDYPRNALLCLWTTEARCLWVLLRVTRVLWVYPSRISSFGLKTV